MRTPGAPAPLEPPRAPPPRAAGAARALLATLVLLLLVLDGASPDADSARLRRAAHVLTGASDAAAADENVALWLRPGPGIPAEVSIDSAAAAAATAAAAADGACRDAPVAVALTGGLGNNLFVAAFGLAHSLRRAGSAAGLALVRTEASDLRGQQVRALERSLFARLRFVDSPSDWFAELRRGRERGPPSGGLATARSSAQALGGYDWRRWCRDVAPEAQQWAAAPCGAEQALTGFFQSAALFRNESALVRRLFAVPEAVAREFREAFPPPRGGGRQGDADGSAVVDTSAGPRGGVPWAIHVRRGDYVDKAEWHHLLPLTYFAEGIARMLAHLEAAGAAGGPVFVFSDDIAWVRAQEPFRGLARAVFMAERDPLRAFYLLALAAEGGVLCSNSTFCWWASFLSELRRRRHFARLALFPDGWTAEHSLSGFHGPGDCGVALRAEFMTVLDGF
jgi:hypothetical protein